MVLKDPRSKEFAAGLLASMVSITVTFPITKLIYRQILDMSSIRASVMKMESEGAKYLFRGLLPPLLQRSTEISLMFGIYKTAEMALKPLELSKFKEKIASSTISGIAESVLTPFERVGTILLDSKHHIKFQNMMHLFIVLGKEYGPREFYRGFSVILLRNVCHSVTFFVVKDEMKRITREKEILPKGIENFIIGASVGLLLSVCFYPLKVIKTHAQKELGGKFKRMMEVSKEVYHHNGGGINNFYKGLELNIVRAMIGWGLTNLAYEFILSKI